MQSSLLKTIYLLPYILNGMEKMIRLLPVRTCKTNTKEQKETQESSEDGISEKQVEVNCGET